MNALLRSRALPSLLTILAAACSSGGISSSPYPYKVGTTHVIGDPNAAEGTGTNNSTGGVVTSNGAGQVGTDRVGVAQVTTVDTPDAEDCVKIADKCAKPQDSCGKQGTADVIVDQNGAVLSTICYPDRDYHVVTLDEAAVTNPALGNNSVVVLDDLDDGVDVQGDLHITGNNVILYGYGPETSVIGGDLSIDKNNAIVRGVRIEGDVEISKNNASLIDCRIDGNLTITGNNVSLALCQIWGTLTISGNNTVFVSNLVMGDQAVAGGNLRCNDNHRFTDADGDGTVEGGEIGEPVVCESAGKK